MYATHRRSSIRSAALAAHRGEPQQVATEETDKCHRPSLSSLLQLGADSHRTANTRAPVQVTGRALIEWIHSVSNFKELIEGPRALTHRKRSRDHGMPTIPAGVCSNPDLTHPLTVSFPPVTWLRSLPLAILADIALFTRAVRPGLGNLVDLDEPPAKRLSRVQHPDIHPSCSQSHALGLFVNKGNAV